MRILSCFTLVAVVPFCYGYTNFSSDYTVSKTKLSIVFQEYADKLLAVSEDMPRPCRKDICYPTSSYNWRKGNMFWPEILTSHKVELRCPFSFKAPVYATKVCTLDAQGVAQWNESNFREVCPDPPMAELLKEIRNEKHELNMESDINGFNKSAYDLLYISILRRISQVFKDYRDTPIFTSDVSDIMLYYVDAIHYLLVRTKDNISLQVAKDFLFILSNVMEDDLKRAMHLQLDNFQSIVEILPYRIEKSVKDPLMLLYPNIAIYVINVNDDTPEAINMTELFTVNYDNNGTINTVLTPNVTVKLSSIKIIPNTSFDIAVTVVREAPLFGKYYYTWSLVHKHISWFIPPLPPPVEDLPERDYEYDLPGSTAEQDSTTKIETIVTENSSSSSSNIDQPQSSGLTKMVADNTSYIDQGFGNGTTPLLIPELITLKGEVHTIKKFFTPSTGIKTQFATTTSRLPTTIEHMVNVEAIPHISYAHRKVDNFNVAGSTIFMTSSNQTVANDIEVLYHTFEDCASDWATESDCFVNQQCARGSSSDHYKGWETNVDYCTALSLPYGGYMSCQCRGLGAFGVFYEHSGGFGIIGPPTDGPYIPPIPVTVKPGDLSSFFSFPYRKELEILGNVLGIISLVCLLLTVISYAIFRRTRKGAPTTILLNLCFALICLSCLLLVIYFSKEAITMEGCTVINTLRYYLVFVTLVWNGIEAFNMYMMLVRVFNSDISKFGVKAGIVAWGIPLVMVGACFGGNRKSFNGQHILVSEEKGECVYKCTLQNTTLYYGYLIPMGLIIIHNFIMFAFVFRAILRHANQLGKEQKKNRLVQLIGAVATLVLLGVPWMFSAFGAIDASKSKNWEVTEIVFQVIFVVFVNLQGLFIFIFHCARNAQMRESWSSVVKDSPLTTKMSMAFHTPRQSRTGVHSASSKNGTPLNSAKNSPKLNKNGTNNNTSSTLVHGVTKSPQPSKTGTHSGSNSPEVKNRNIPVTTDINDVVLSVDIKCKETK